MRAVTMRRCKHCNYIYIRSLNKKTMKEATKLCLEQGDEPTAIVIKHEALQKASQDLNLDPEKNEFTVFDINFKVSERNKEVAVGVKDGMLVEVLNGHVPYGQYPYQVGIWSKAKLAYELTFLASCEVMPQYGGLIRG